MSYGINYNMSLIINDDGTITSGLNIEDSEGVNINSERSAESFDELWESLIDDIVDQMIPDDDDDDDDECDDLFEDIDDLDDRITALEDEIESILIDNAILQSRIDAIVNSNSKPKQETKVLKCNCGCDKEYGNDNVIHNVKEDMSKKEWLESLINAVFDLAR